MKDFTLKCYTTLLEAFLDNNYTVSNLKDYFSKDKSFSKPLLILRHDVDRLPQNALKTAVIEKEFGIKSTYYFRLVKGVYNQKVIEQIAGAGHEIGYHYEDIDLAARKIVKNKGKIDSRLELIEEATKSFISNLNKIRESYPVKTICMHGSPLSKYDNRLLWEHISYKDYGITGEPYYDIDYSKVLYLTDTGRSWCADKANLRDKVNSGYNSKYSKTYDIIKAIKYLPDQVMLNAHPQRWHDNNLLWFKELFMQNGKNMIKYIINNRRTSYKII